MATTLHTEDAHVFPHSQGAARSGPRASHDRAMLESARGFCPRIFTGSHLASLFSSLITYPAFGAYHLPVTIPYDITFGLVVRRKITIQTIRWNGPRPGIDHAIAALIKSGTGFRRNMLCRNCASTILYLLVIVCVWKRFPYKRVM